MRVILLGPPGSGKGTQGDLVTRKYGFPRISTGDLLRAAVQERTPLGLKAKAVMDSGELVRDDMVISLVEERIALTDCGRGYVLDGFPRTIAQARAIESLDPEQPEVAFYFRVDEEAVVLRLSSRRICGGCGAVFNLRSVPVDQGCRDCGAELVQRSDDRPEVIRERLRVYRERTQPLKGYYRDKSSYFEVDGTRGIEAVFADVAAVLDEALSAFEDRKRIG